jgi:2-dehydropantoate 2-reductase
MRVTLFGTGAMSCLFGARLSQVAQVTIIGTWADSIRAIRERGILLEESCGSRTFRTGAEYLGAPLEPADLVIVLVKSWQTAAVAQFLPRYLSRDGLAVSLQNGLGNIEILGERAYPGSTAVGATLLGPGHVRAGGSGPTHAVVPSWVVDLFKIAGFECFSCSPAQADGLIWGKLSVSCGINALTALLRVPNGELLNRPTAADLMARAAAECAAVASAIGVRLPFADAAARVREVAVQTASNRSSMLQDIMRGAPTECDAINGAVAEEGKRLQVPTPVNEILWQLVKAAVHRTNRSDLQ